MESENIVTDRLTVPIDRVFCELDYVKPGSVLTWLADMCTGGES